MVLPAIAGGVFAAEIPPVPPLKTFYTEVPIAHGGAPNCLIAVPPGDEYAQVGQKIAAAIKAVSGAAIPVQDASSISAEALQSSNMILVGYFANNPLVERLYDEHYVALDAQWPGAGGYVIRTVHDPTGQGTCFVYLGGVDEASVAKAADDFISTLPEKGDISYPHTVKVVMPDGSPAYKPSSETLESQVEAAKGKNYGALGGIVTEAATSYYLTGNPEGLELFKRTMPLLGEFVEKLKKIEAAGGAIHLMNMWDNIEEAPQFSEEDRAQITEWLWEFAHKWIDANETGAEDRPTPVGNYHNGRLSWDLARYFKKYYDVDAANLWTTMTVFFQSKAKFWRSAEDCAGYGGATMMDTLYYVLPAGYEQFWESGTGRKMGDYGIAVLNNLGGHAGFGDTSAMWRSGYWGNILLTCAWKYRDGRYMYAYNRTKGMEREALCHSTYLQDVVEPVLPEDMLGVHVVPLPDWVYEHRESVLGTAPKAMNAVLDADPVPPREECFDKITFRSSFEPSDQYLIVGGISHGYHAHPDGNSLIELTDKNRYCLFDSGYFVPDTIEHNTLAIYRQGLFEPVPRLTGLAALGDFEDVGMTQTYVNGYNGANWRRNIIWNKEKYFLVIDEVEAQEVGDYSIKAVFRTLADNGPVILDDRASAFAGGRSFKLVSAGYTPIKLSTSATSSRKALIEPKSAAMQAGDRQYLCNLLYCTEWESQWPHEMVKACEGAVMVKSPEGYALAGTRACRPMSDLSVDAAVFYVTRRSFALTSGRQLRAERPWFTADTPVNIELKLGPKASGTIEAAQDTTVSLWARGDEIELDGQAVKGRSGPQGLEVAIPAGKHRLSFEPGAETIGSQDWSAVYLGLEKQHRERLAGLKKEAEGGAALAADWTFELATKATRTVYLNAQGDEVINLTSSGKASAWTEGTLKSTRMGDCVDGRPETYSAGYGEHAKTLPKDFGMQWNNPVSIACFQIDYVSHHYGPTMEGQQLQAWDGENWYPVQAEITKDEAGARWTYLFDPVETTRMRIFITDFATGMRTAVSEMRFFPEPAVAEHREVRVGFPIQDMAAYDVDGDGQAELLVIAKQSLKCLNGDGELVWEKELEAGPLCVDAYDLEGDGRGEVLVGADDCKLYCFDHQGNELWSVLTPTDAPYSEREPSHGRVEVVGCADLDADGDGEVVVSCSHSGGGINWHAYAYDHAGNLLWRALNWAHPATSICFVDVGEGKLGTFIGTRYNSANAFGPDGKGIGSVSVGYHGAAMSVAAGDLDGNGKAELIAGSRVGGLHCGELGTKKAWMKFMGAEVTQVALADLVGDGNLEVIAGSKNYCLLATDADGEILWSSDMGDAVADVVTADLDGNGAPEIVVGTEGGRLRVVDNSGKIVATFAGQGDLTKVLVADLDGNGQMEIVAASNDGYVYGGVH